MADISLKLIIFSLIHRVQESLGIKRGKFYFEYLYAKKNDMWDYRTSEYEKEKYNNSFELIADRKYENALEIGCSIGVFTNKLSDIAQHVTALDISAIAIKTAKKECEGKNNIDFQVSDFFKFNTDKTFDIICAAEVLYYLAGDEKMIKDVVHKVESLLNDNGLVLYVCGNWEIDTLNDWENYFQNYGKTLKTVKTVKVENIQNNYRISLIQKVI